MSPPTTQPVNEASAMSLAKHNTTSTLLSTYPFDVRPSPTVSRAWVEGHVAVPNDDQNQKRKRKRDDRGVDTALGALQIKRHGNNSVEAITTTTNITPSQFQHAQRLDYLQATWPRGEIIPPKYRDPAHEDVRGLPWHVVYHLHTITKAFKLAKLPLEIMWEEPEADTTSSPRGLLVRHMAPYPENYITAKAAKSARDKVKRSGWPNAPQAMPAPVNPLHAPLPSTTSRSTRRRPNPAPLDIRSSPVTPSDNDSDNDVAPLDDADDTSMGGNDWETDNENASANNSPERPRHQHAFNFAGAGDVELGSSSLLVPSSPSPEDDSPPPLFEDVTGIAFPSDTPTLFPPVAHEVNVATRDRRGHTPTGHLGQNSPSPEIQEVVDKLLGRTQDDRLDSQHIHHILKCLCPSENLAKEWKIFDAGYPFAMTNEDNHGCGTSKQPNNLLFIPQVDNEEHWSVAHLNRQEASVMYYDSQQSPTRFKKLQQHLGSWIIRKQLVDPSLPLAFQCMASPQQTDGWNCGVFAIETIRRLVHGLDIVAPVDPGRCRQEWAHALCTTHGADNSANPDRVSDIHTDEDKELQAEGRSDTVVKEQAAATIGDQNPHPAGGDFVLPRRNPISRQEAQPRVRSSQATMWSASQLQEGSRYMLSQAPELSEALRSVDVAEMRSKMRESDHQLETRLSEAQSALDKLEKDHGQNFLVEFETQLNDIDRLLREKQKDRESKEKSISAMECHMERHKAQTGTLAEALSEDFFVSVRLVTEEHIASAQQDLRAINEELSRLTRESTQLRSKLDTALSMQETVKSVSQERRKISAGMAWLACLE